MRGFAPRRWLALDYGPEVREGDGATSPPYFTSSRLEELSTTGRPRLIHQGRCRRAIPWWIRTPSEIPRSKHGGRAFAEGGPMSGQSTCA